MAREKKVSCPVERALAVIGGKWKVLVLYHLSSGTKRFGELHRLLPGVSPRTLTKQLKELEFDGIITRKVYPQIPPKVEYSLSRRGRELDPVLAAMHEYGLKYPKREV
jgi:DNA-binding HxlR family transcriptional regulator